MCELVASCPDANRLRDAFASSRRFWRTSHQGDSGAKMTATKMGMGQNHLSGGQYKDNLVGDAGHLLNSEGNTICPGSFHVENTANYAGG
jgi:hypothetical protein